jgi:integrase
MNIPTEKDTLATMVAYYKKSPLFCGLTAATQVSYDRHLNKSCITLVQGKELGNIKLKYISIKHLSDAYEQWLSIGRRTANLRAAVLNVVFKYAMQKEITHKNPINNLTRKADGVRSVKWSRSDVRKFLSVAYADFRWRSIGLITHMSYDWAQRVGDMRNLKWSAINFDEKRLDIKQSKRGAEVHLPISENLIKMLRQQEKDFGFQEYVAPRVRPIGQSYTPYNIKEVSYLMNEVKDKAKLPRELRAMDLRRTAITEMVEGGVDLAGVMQVSGHRSPQSVKPYLVNTYSGAVKALEGRKGNEH